MFLAGKVDFLDEQKLYDLAHYGNYDKIAEMIWGIFLIYPAMWFVFSVITIIIQIKINPNWKDVDNYKDLDKEFGNEPKDLPKFLMEKETEGADNENKEGEGEAQ